MFYLKFSTIVDHWVKISEFFRNFLNIFLIIKFHSGSTKTYFVTKTKKLNWDSAKSNCETLGMNLATFESNSQGVSFYNIVKKNTWVGIRDVNKNGQFLQVTDNTDVRHILPWRRNEPSGREFCVHSWAGNGFNDINCNHAFFFACEMMNNDD